MLFSFWILFFKNSATYEIMATEIGWFINEKNNSRNDADLFTKSSLS